MAPKKATTKASVPTASDFSTGDIVLTKLKGFPEWPGKIIEQSSAPEAVIKQKAGKPFLVRFYPDADYVWAYPRELRPLTPKIIDVYLSDSSKKPGKLRQGYEIAKNPSEWEKQQAEKDAAIEDGNEEEAEEDEDMLMDEGEGKATAGTKRKRGTAAKEPKAPKAKKETASKGKKEPAAKKRKTDDKPKASKATKESKESKDKAGSATATAADEDGSKEEQTVKSWRANLQRAFLTKGVPSADKMPEYHTIFSEMEKFDMQPQWLASSKLGKVLKKMAALTEEIPREAEFKIKERANALMEAWKGMLNKEPTSTSAGAANEETTGSAEDKAGDMTVMQEDEKKNEDKPDEAVAADGQETSEAKDTTNGVNGGVNADGQGNGTVEEDVAADASKLEEGTSEKAADDTPAEEKTATADASTEEAKENGTTST